LFELRVVHDRVYLPLRIREHLIGVGRGLLCDNRDPAANRDNQGKEILFHGVGL
jgi:hypothetical protein